MSGLLVSHASSWHDGGVAIRRANGEVLALSSERVGDRFKHTWNSGHAYDHLRSLLGIEELARLDDRFLDCRDGLKEHDLHHAYHAASAFFSSTYERAGVLVVDGQGPAGDRLSTTTIWRADDARLELLDDLQPGSAPFADQSLGHFFTAATALAGFESLFAEGKAMALASFGELSAFGEYFRRYVRRLGDGAFTIDPALTVAILNHTFGPEYHAWPPPSDNSRRIWAELSAMFADDSPWPNQDHMNVAFAAQELLTEIMLGLARRTIAMSGVSSVCLAGGVALNCVANGVLRRELGADKVHVAPYPADDGQALGKLLYISATEQNNPIRITSPFLGPRYETAEVGSHVRHAKDLGATEVAMADGLENEVARLLAQGNIVGCVFGRSESGPRALGHRSLLADPRQAEARDALNAIKGREWFRPVAPAVLEERADDYFELGGIASPTMSFAVDATDLAKSTIPAAVHVDGTARVQTVSAASCPELRRIIEAFDRLTDVPVLLNTSFNGDGEPIVETGTDAFECARRMGLKYLVLEDVLLMVSAS